jgi:lipocalin
MSAPARRIDVSTSITARRSSSQPFCAAALSNKYRAALEAEPRAPTKWLAERMYVSLPTARRWIQRARDLGYLGASIPGKAGERKGKRKR